MVPWERISGQDWGAILIGNGASRAVWEDFKYESLYQNADLGPHESAVFAALETHNFERVLDSLRVARAVCKAVGHPPEDAENLYLQIRAELVMAITDLHVPHALVDGEVLLRINGALRRYRNVYTTNYDLILYWAVMAKEPWFKDFFWAPDCSFDPTDVALSTDAPAIHYLHGALHLSEELDHTTRKLVANGASLLDHLARAGTVPLFVSEGSAADKDAAIRRSPYLSFVNQRFAEDAAPLVVFGFSFDKADRHIAARLVERPRRLAISVHSTAPNWKVDAFVGKVREALSSADGSEYRGEIAFFDSKTHPLGSPSLRVHQPDASLTPRS